MNLTTYFTGWITTKLLKTLAWIGIPMFLLYQCNRGCGSTEHQYNSFDYTAIATVIVSNADSVNLPEKDSVEYSIELVAKELERVVPDETIEFAKANSSQFAKFLSTKYVLSNGYVERIDLTK